MNWLKINFAVAFSAWIHLKALRTFVESVLRYGLPVNFQAAVVRVSYALVTLFTLSSDLVSSNY